MGKSWMRFVFHPDHLIVVVIALLLTWAFAALFDVLGMKNPYQKSVSANSLSETVFQYEGDDEVSVTDNVVVIDLGTRANRMNVAGVLAALDSIEPLAIGVDAIFAQPSAREADSCLTATLSAMRTPVVMARMTDDDGNTVQSYFADSLGLRSGSVMLDVDNSGVVHTFCAIQENGDSSMVAMLNDLWNDRYGLEQGLELRTTPLLVDYHTDCRVIPAEQVADRADEIAGRIALIGVTSTGGDVVRVPTARVYMPGVEVHAACLETLHNTEEYPQEIPFWVNLIIAMALSYTFEVLLTLIQKHLPAARRPLSVFMREWLRNSYLTNVVLLPMLTVLTILMINATLHGRYYMFTFIFTAIVLVPESRNIYKALLAALRMKWDGKWLQNNLL
ncbi:MAG: CHASE2 domain-containing protein [Muribaculaceae bacterium]|nr:CHASE2 domain-containing protein [Muribaculaceae bacterium]